MQNSQKIIIAVLVLVVVAIAMIFLLKSDSASETVQQPVTALPFSETINKYIVTEAPRQEITVMRGNFAVYLDRNGVQMGELRKASSSDDDFASLIDDWIYYMSDAGMFLSEKNITRLKGEEGETRYFQFTYYKNKYYFDTFANDDDWDRYKDIIFFSDTKMPKIINITMIKDEFSDYYGL